MAADLLIPNNVTVRKPVIKNDFFSAGCSFIGVYIGLFVKNEKTRKIAVYL